MEFKLIQFYSILTLILLTCLSRTLQIHTSIFRKN